MRRLTSLVLGLALISPLTFTGCGEDNTSKVQVTRETPGGTTTETVTKKTEASGENPPPATGTSGQPTPR